MKKTAQDWLFPLLLATALLPAGCATDRQLRPKDNPPGSVNISTGETILVLKFIDQRPKRELGRAGAVGPRVFLEDDVGSWIGQAVFSELQRARCKVEKARKRSESSSGVIITGDILEAEARSG